MLGEKNETVSISQFFLANTEETDNPEIILKVINSKNYEIYNDDDELLLKGSIGNIFEKSRSNNKS